MPKVKASIRRCSKRQGAKAVTQGPNNQLKSALALIDRTDQVDVGCIRVPGKHIFYRYRLSGILHPEITLNDRMSPDTISKIITEVFEVSDFVRDYGGSVLNKWRLLRLCPGRRHSRHPLEVVEGVGGGNISFQDLYANAAAFVDSLPEYTSIIFIALAKGSPRIPLANPGCKKSPRSRVPAGVMSPCTKGVDPNTAFTTNAHKSSQERTEKWLRAVRKREGPRTISSTPPSCFATVVLQLLVKVLFRQIRLLLVVPATILYLNQALE
ncbi:hypothetical protein BKA70DRAFT_1240669 [Coprinopsis sp. MPI-PUGE-AT-0042]|nr:hypothetical protein BKA70DRAFT_1240669 [Coprinopsis sp. MPI-PUGE-AT-0042]